VTTLVSPGVSVTIIDDSYYIPASAPTVPLFFIATRADKTQTDGVTPAPGVLENGVVRTITSLTQSIATYGVPYFRVDGSNNQLNGDARNEYGLFALNQFLTQGNVAYVVRGDVDLADAPVITYTAGTPTLTGTGSGTIGTITLNQATVAAEQWTLVGTSQGGVQTTGSITGGTLYTTGTYSGVALTGGSGTGATANITVAGGAVVAFQIVAKGTNYIVGDVLSAAAASIGGTGSGFHVAVASLYVNAFTVTGFVSGSQGSATVGTPYNNGIISLTITAGGTPFSVGDTFAFTITSTTTMNPLGANDAAKRVTITTALAAQINSNPDVRSDIFEYNILVCPAYFEVVTDLLNLNDAIFDEAFVIADTPFTNTPEATATWAVTMARQNDTNVGYYYPHATAANLDGVIVFVAASGVALKTFAYSDNLTNVWYPPAGPRRGVITGLTDIGYVTGTLGTATTFVSAPLNQGQRDILYQDFANINPITYLPGRGFLVYGQKTSPSAASALDRINVARLLLKIKRDIRKASISFLFELNNRITQDSIAQMITNYLQDILNQNGLYDFAVVCDSSNNPPDVVDSNELYVNIAVQPQKSIEFIYIPITVTATGATTA
jgi:phage tail sheath protein FI